nr:hypothetical protein [Tanacetum cinerariifolium]
EYVKAVDNVDENESCIVTQVIDDDLCALAMLTKCLVRKRGGMISGGGGVFRVVRSSLREKPGGARGVVSEESMGGEGGVT